MSKQERIRPIGRPADVAGLVLLLIQMLIVPARAQTPKPVSTSVKPQAAGAKDPLGRTTPRDAVLGFLNAARKGEDQRAAQYLNTRERGDGASTLARQLFVVLNSRLPAQLQKLSDEPEGSLADPLNPRQELVGRMDSNSGAVDILLERVDRGGFKSIWLFSRQTLEQIPDVYQEIETVSIHDLLPEFLIRTRLLGIPLFECLALLVGLPLLYLTTALLNRLVGALIGRVVRYLLKKPDLPNPRGLAMPARLLVVALTIYTLISKVSLPLLARQFWSGVATFIAIASCTCLAILLFGRLENYARLGLERRNNLALSSVLRLARRTADLSAIFAGFLIGLSYFRLNATAVLAGLGVGGIAIALAAQKTLENVIGGISIIVDDVVHVGDSLKVGDTIGDVEDIGLRSTRIRTLDRTVVSIPNGLIANLSPENLSRDKFWLHNFVGLRYDTTPSQVGIVVASFEALLVRYPLVEPSSVRVRFLRFGASSLDLEVFAYVFARDYAHFLEIQNDVLLRLMEVVLLAGTQIALHAPVFAINARRPLLKTADRRFVRYRRRRQAAKPRAW